MKKYPFVLQHDEQDCGAACFSMVVEYFGRKMKLEKCRNIVRTGSEGTSIYNIVRGADVVGLESEAYECDVDDFIRGIKEKEISLPIIARVITSDMYDHFIVIYDIGKKIIIGDPGEAKLKKILYKQLSDIWLGQVITFSKTDEFLEGNERTSRVKELFSYVKRYTGVLIGILLISVGIALINYSGAVLFEFILSGRYNTFFIFGRVVTSGIEKITVCLMIMYLLRLVIEIVRGKILTAFSKNIGTRITLDMYSRLMVIPPERFAKRNTGEFISRFYDVGQINNAVSLMSVEILFDAAVALLCGGILARKSMILFLISVGTVILCGIVMLVFQKKIRKENHRIMSDEARVTSVLKEQIDGAQTVKSFNLEKKSIDRFSDIYRRYANRVKVKTEIINVQDSLTAFISSLGLLFVISVGYKNYLHSYLTMGDLFSFYYLLGFFITPVAEIVGFQPHIEAGINAFERISDIFDMGKEKIRDDIDEILEGDIVINHVSFGYDYDDYILDDLSLTIERGKKTAIIGESGSGKSTLAKLIVGFYIPEKGDILIGNQNIKECPVNILRGSVAYISQDVFLFEDSFYNNLVLGRRDVEMDWVMQCVEMCGLDELTEKLPQGLESTILENGCNLSGGEKQRIAIARALIQRKKIMILDEAASNLDQRNKEIIWDLIFDKMHGITCLIITHNMDILNKCDHVVQLEHTRR